MNLKWEAFDHEGKERVRLFVESVDGHALVLGVFEKVPTMVEAQVLELKRIAALPSLPEKTLNRPRNLPIHNWFWMGIALICAGLVIAAPYFIR